MSDALKYSSVKTDTLNFRKYRKYAVDILVRDHGISAQKARTLSLLLEILEGHRISFSKGDYRFQTKRVSAKSIACDLGVTERYVRMLLRILENAEIINIRRRQVNRFMSLWNAFEFTGFIKWLTSFAQTGCAPVPPKEESNSKLLFSRIAFPTTDLTTFDKRHRFWRQIAMEVLPQGNQMPCLAAMSKGLRQNLRKNNVDHDDPSIIARWKSYVKRAIAFEQQARGQYAS